MLNYMASWLTRSDAENTLEATNAVSIASIMLLLGDPKEAESRAKGWLPRHNSPVPSGAASNSRSAIAQLKFVAGEIGEQDLLAVAASSQIDAECRPLVDWCQALGIRETQGGEGVISEGWRVSRVLVHDLPDGHGPLGPDAGSDLARLDRKPPLARQRCRSQSLWQDRR